MTLNQLQMIDQMVVSMIGCFGSPPMKNCYDFKRVYGDLRGEISDLLGDEKKRDLREQLPSKANDKADELRQWIVKNWRFSKQLPSL